MRKGKEIWLPLCQWKQKMCVNVSLLKLTRNYGKESIPITEAYGAIFSWNTGLYWSGWA